jgi:hypothetical protein
MFIPRPVLGLGAVVLLLLAPPIAAQSVPTAGEFPLPPSSVTRPAVAAVDDGIRAPVGPTAERSVAGIRVDARATAQPAPAAAVARVGRNPAMMIVGGAALIVGAVIGGDAGTIVMVGGALVGLVGLWNYLR